MTDVPTVAKPAAGMITLSGQLAVASAIDDNGGRHPCVVILNENHEVVFVIPLTPESARELAAALCEAVPNAGMAS